MNKKFPYEEVLKKRMDNIDVPNEDEAWQKMKALLDEDDKRRPFAYIKNYKLAGALIIAAFIGLGLFFYQTSSLKDKPVSKTKNNLFIKEKPVAGNNKQINYSPVIQRKNEADSTLSKLVKNRFNHSNQIGYKAMKPVDVKRQIQVPALAKEDKQVTVKLTGPFTSIQKKQSDTKDISIAKNKVAGAGNNGQATQNAATILSPDTMFSSLKGHSNNTSATTETAKGESVFNQPKTTVAKADTATKEAVTSKKAIAKNKKNFIISAGVGVQQQIPVAGQQAVSYGYNGTKNTLSDYIPSVYVRFEKDRKWFIQAEYVYSSPQLIRAFSYNRQTIIDYSASTITTTNYHLRKTFYNQVPVSFNYYVHQNLSVGAGIVYNSFRGAISEKEVTTNNVATQTQTVTKQIIPMAGYTDSFLYKSHLYLLLQTDYNWRRLSVGLRYSRDVQPFIKYTMPNGTITNERNWALECILRFKLFKSVGF